jgi:Uma2 family endonuclease
MEASAIALPSTLKLNIDLTDEQYFQLCQSNRDYRFERTASGKLLIMPLQVVILADVMLNNHSIRYLEFSE